MSCIYVHVRWKLRDFLNKSLEKKVTCTSIARLQTHSRTDGLCYIDRLWFAQVVQFILGNDSIFAASIPMFGAYKCASKYWVGNDKGIYGGSTLFEASSSFLFRAPYRTIAMDAQPTQQRCRHLFFLVPTHVFVYLSCSTEVVLFACIPSEAACSPNFLPLSYSTRRLKCAKHAKEHRTLASEPLGRHRRLTDVGI